MHLPLDVHSFRPANNPKCTLRDETTRMAVLPLPITRTSYEPNLAVP